MQVDVADYLTKQKVPSELAPFYQKFADLYERKYFICLQRLWHQLTLALQEFVKIPSSQPFLYPLYTNVIRDFESKLNQLSLIQYLALVARTMKPQEALAFLLEQKDKIKEKDALVYATMEAAHYRLLTNDLEGCAAAISECEKILEGLSGVDTTINACFYRVSADYFKIKAAYPQFYHNALLFLSSVNVDALSPAERLERAHDLAIAAILGEGLYNFGELVRILCFNGQLLHPILDSLKGSQLSWLRDLLFTFNTGDMDAFEKIASGSAFKAQPLFVSAIAFIRQKLCLMTLVESVFRRSKEERAHLSFAQVSKECRVAVDEVEHLVMKALSLGLVKGKIDQVTSDIQISWVQPRVLDMSQVKTIAERLGSWSSGVKARVDTLGVSETVFVQ